MRTGGYSIWYICLMQRQPMGRGLLASMILMNYWPFFYALFTLVLSWELPATRSQKVLCLIALTYIVPPLLCRLTVLFFGKPAATNRVGSRGYWVWWFTAQCQAVFLRFPALEEIIRMVPGLYSLWLRFWGAEVGNWIYWGPGVKIVDRPFVHIEDLAVIGFGSQISSHGYFFPPGELESGAPSVQFGIPVVRKRAIIGGISGLSPGSEVAENELLPASMLLAPFYLWKEGRRHAR
jgi:hypothetical protein